MASSMNSQESQSLSFFDVSSYLVLVEVWSPGLSDFPVKLIDPLEGSVSGNGTISVSGVEQFSVLVLEFLIYPLGSVLAFGVFDFRSAHIPWLDGGWDVEERSHIDSVQVLNDWVSKGAWWEVSELLGESPSLIDLLEGPWGIVSGSEGLFVCSDAGASLGQSKFRLI